MAVSDKKNTPVAVDIFKDVLLGYVISPEKITPEVDSVLLMPP